MIDDLCLSDVSSNVSDLSYLSDLDICATGVTPRPSFIYNIYK